MSFKIRIELFKELEITSLDFESNAATQILSRFDQIDWMQQVVWGYMEEHHGDFPFFKLSISKLGVSSADYLWFIVAINITLMHMLNSIKNNKNRIFLVYLNLKRCPVLITMTFLLRYFGIVWKVFYVAMIRKSSV